MNLDYVLELIRDEEYFILHAPRQTGKTSTLLALQDLLNSGSEGPYRCLYVNVEPGQALRENIGEAMRSIVGALASSALERLGDGFLDEHGFDILERYGPSSGLLEILRRWARADPRPLVLLVDEIDALVGDTLISVLRQLRSGHQLRPASFPHSIVLCGVRDLRDYRIHSGSRREAITGGSAFNIAADSLRLGDFSEAEVKALLGQHTSETGQAFRPEAIRRVWNQTRGQPWLVNALCRRTCSRNNAINASAGAVTEDAVLEAQEQLILERAVHLDQLADKLQEDRVRRVIEPLLISAPPLGFSVRDYEYVRDLGLVASDDPIRIANPIYAEVVPRELTFVAQKGLQQRTAWYVGRNGLDLKKLLGAFQEYFRQESEHWLAGSDYKEAGPQLLLHAFLQRVVNGGGRIEREYAVGRGRTDLLVLWPHSGRTQRFRNRVQDYVGQCRKRDQRRIEADRRVHGPVRCGRGASIGFRP